MDPFEQVTRYTIVRQVAQGGAGVVYEAQQSGVEGFSKRVAIKMLREKHVRSPKVTAMFLREAKLVARLVHENIVQIYQLGRHDEAYFIAMEYVHGVSLSDLLRVQRGSGDRLPIELAVFIASRVARGLAYAPARRDDDGTNLGIVHRDVSPQNVLITSEGLPKLADFGLAVLARDVRTSIDPAGKLVYMAPEQARGSEIDHRADIFGLGAVLFEMLAGRAPRRGDDFQEILRMAQEGIILWDHLPAEVPDELVQLLTRCLAMAPDHRFSDATELARCLEESIYRHGYGPTINTLEAYLRKLLPDLYVSAGSDAGRLSSTLPIDAQTQVEDS